MDLGAKARDTISGFSGIVTARCVYLHDTTSVQLTATEVNADGETLSNWYPEKRVESV